MKTIYALMIGIDDYPPPVRKLRGCVNDIKEMEAYLKARVEPGEGRTLDEALKIRTLADGEATREAVIRAFRDHLGQAGEGDVALLCYSGHGSQEQAPQEFWHLEPDHLNETLVCYDSRTEGAHDLADKELAKLIREVAGAGRTSSSCWTRATPARARATWTWGRLACGESRPTPGPGRSTASSSPSRSWRSSARPAA